MPKSVCVISRQRIIGNTNGSSVYVLSLCHALWKAGMAVDYVCPSPTVFGRWPLLIMRPEMKMFRSIKIRGSIRIGSVFFALDPRIGLKAVLTILLKKLGFHAFDKPAPYSISFPLSNADIRYLGQHADADTIIADYAWMADGIPHVKCRNARSAVIMHDLLSSTEAGPLDKVGLSTELKLLSQANAVVAIQQTEAAIVQSYLPRHKVILAPLAVETVPYWQTGDDDQEFLYVASKTKANIAGLEWFLEKVWPIIRRRNSKARFMVAGTVSEAFPSVPEGVQLLGFQQDISAWYTRVAVVISPLRGGSGLKIKLIEAMAHGKAIVATTTTLQGVEEIISPAVIVTDDAEEFASGILKLLDDRNLRARYASAALSVAREKFSAAACYADFVAYMMGNKTGASHA